MRRSHLPELGETNPQLLALWLRRAIRPDTVLPDLPVQAGARKQQAFRPAPLQNRLRSKSSERIEAQGDTPALSLHVAQPRQCDLPAQLSSRAIHQDLQGLESETFFTDSLSTV